MKRIFRTVKPDYEGNAKLFKAKELVAEIYCQVWFPRHTFERPFLFFKSTDDNHKKIRLISHKYDVVIEITGFDKEVFRKILVKNMFVDNFSAKHFPFTHPPLITFHGTPEAITETPGILLL